MRTKFLFEKLRDQFVVVISGPQILAFLPALCLGAFWLGGERVLLAVALGLPLLFAVTGNIIIWPLHLKSSAGRSRGMMGNDLFRETLDEFSKAAGAVGSNSACIIVALDDYAEIHDLHGQATAEYIFSQFGARLLSMIRSEDIATQIEQNKFLIGLTPSEHLNLEACIQMSGRIQSAVEEPVALNEASIYISCSIGFCMLSNIPETNAEGWIEATRAALSEAQKNGPSTIRAYTAETYRRSIVQTNLRKEIDNALDNGQICPWFQPQISTDTGQITGFEALARWEHPVKGVLSPHVFLPFAEQAKLMERFGQVIRHHAFSAMQAWDRAAVIVPRIGINFSSDELRNPALLDRLKWELDQFDLTPDRLAIEILETVFSRRPDDVITRNITGLAKLGCCIDLDDFGTGHASIASIKRFEVTRIKIDRSFVTKSDQDPSQQQMVSAILTMAERLNVETLAEGVETPGEHALMAQLGSNHVQGFGIAKPMPFEKTLGWITAHRSKMKGTPKIGRKTG